MTKQEAKEVLKLTMERSNCAMCRYKGQCNDDYVICDIANDIAIECIEKCIEHEETFEWCDTCKEYDQENYCCHRWSKCIKSAVEELEEFYKLESKGLVPQTTVIG